MTLENSGRTLDVMITIYYVGLCVWLLLGSGAVLGLALLRRRTPAALESAFLGGVDPVALGLCVPVAAALWPLGALGVVGLVVSWALGAVRPLARRGDSDA